MSSLLLLAALANAGPSVTVAVPAPPHVRLVQAVQLPIQTRALRRAGALEVDVQLSLSGARRHHLPPSDVVLVFGEYITLGVFQGFGPFVVSQWDDGVRGPAIVRAIRVKNKSYVYKHDNGNHYGQRKNGGNGHGPYDDKHGGKHLASAGNDGSHGKSRGSSASSNASNGRGGGGGKGKGNDKGKK